MRPSAMAALAAAALLASMAALCGSASAHSTLHARHDHRAVGALSPPQAQAQAQAEEKTAVDFGAATPEPLKKDELRFAEQELDALTAPGSPNASREADADPYSGACMHVPFSVCVGTPLAGGVTAITGTQPPKGLVGAWTFDEVGAQDSSGLLQAMRPAPPAGPGFLSGASAHLNGSIVPTIRHHSQYDSDSFSVEFWLYVIRDSIGGFQTLFHKGRRDGDVTVAAPGVQMWPDTRRLHVSVSTGPRHKVTVDSAGGVPLRRWTHVAVVVDGRILQVFLNGILDTEYLMPGPLMPNEDPIYVGNDPWLGNGLVAYLDELKIYRRGLTADEVNAVGSNAFPGLSSRNIRLGCGNCPFAEARTSCPEYYHLCARNELRTGALTVARTMGWVENLADPDAVVWEGDGVPSDGTGVGLCCRDDAAM